MIKPLPDPSSPDVPLISGPTEKLKPSAGGVVPPPRRILKSTISELTPSNAPVSRSSIRNPPVNELTALVNFRAPLFPTPPSDSTTAEPETDVPGGTRPSLKLAEKVPADNRGVPHNVTASAV